METKTLEKLLIKSNLVLSVFDTRYSLGIMAFLSNDEGDAQEVIDAFNGGDEEAISSESFFRNDVAPAVFCKTIPGAIMKLEEKLAGVPEVLLRDYWSLVGQIHRCWKVRMNGGPSRLSYPLQVMIRDFEIHRKRILQPPN